MIFELCVLFISIFILCKAFKKPPGLPPGKWGLPFVGGILPTGKDLGKMVQSLQKKHGSIFHVKSGSRIFVFITDSQAIKKSLEKFEFSGRPDFFALRVFTNFQKLGIAFSDGQIWQDNRRFTIKHLRDYGLGRSSIEDKIRIEVESFLGDIKSKTDKPIAIGWSLNVAILNILWSFVADKRYELHDQEIQDFSNIIEENFKIMDGPLALLNLFPQLSFILPNIIKHKWMNLDKLQNNIEKLKIFMLEIFKEHSTNIDLANPRDLIDSYLIEKDVLVNNPDLILDDDLRNLIAIMMDLFIAGSETTSSVIRWFFLYMSAHQTIQEKLLNEIDAVVPKDRLPALSDRDMLPYLNASLYELHRIVSLVPDGLAHSALEDTSFEGYSIPKGAIIVTCLQTSHKNPKLWEKPEEFHPEHFMNEDGKFSGERKGYFPFGHGRRSCIGEQLAKQSLFLFAASVLQQFKILPCTSGEEGKVLNLDPVRALLNIAPPFKVVLKKRE